MITYQRCQDLSHSANITYNNMQPYYAHHNVDWDQANILQLIAELDNWDIISNGEVIGAIRLAFDSEGCYLRDLQVSTEHQNQGIGAQAIQEAKRLALNAGANTLRLRVMKISPAYHLYARNGFVTSHEDERFYYMEQDIS